jgi:phenylalanyl-tRNA synthetase beta subunit
VVPWQHPSFIEGRVGLIATTDGVPHGFLGELSPVVLTNWGMRTPIAAFELSLNGVGALLSVV